MIYSRKETFDVAHSLQPAARTATANGTGVDLANFFGATVLVVAGAWTDGSHAITLQESDDNSTFTAVAAADYDGSLPTISSAGTASQTYRIGYKGSKRYVRAVSTVTSATTGAVYGVIVVQHDPRKAPV